MEVNVEPSSLSEPQGRPEDERGATGSGQPAALRVKRELESGWFQFVSMPLPALLTIQSGINQLRYATLKGIMAAKKKEVRVVPAAAGGASRQRIVDLYVPQKAKKTEMIGGSAADAAKQLVKALREDARAL
jgi:electron transfer flavoprotein beta subunit